MEYDGESLQSRHVVSDLGLSASSMQAALNALVSAHLIRQAGEGGSLRFRLIDPFMAAWQFSFGKRKWSFRKNYEVPEPDDQL